MLSHQHDLEMDNRGSGGSSIFSDFHQSKESVEIGDTSLCDQDINDLQKDNHSIDALDIVSNAPADLWCQEGQFDPFENMKDNEQIFI